MGKVTICTGHGKKSILERMIALVSPRATDLVLDLGTGEKGNTALALTPHVKEVITLDWNEEALQRFEDRLSEMRTSGKTPPSNLRLLHTSVESMFDFDDESFDIVTCRAAFHHLPNPRKGLKQIYRILKAGGKFDIMDPILSDDGRDAWVALTKKKEIDLENMYTYQEYIDMITDAGFFIEAMIPFKFERYFNEWVETAYEGMRETLKEEMLRLPPRLIGELRLKKTRRNEIDDLVWYYNGFELLATKDVATNTAM